jgi:2-amino-4-hydroxy-6-hydroxymethyldihydropteridine diphosphokinase
VLQTTSMSSPTTSASRAETPAVIALGSNLGDRSWNLRRAIAELSRLLVVVRVSRFRETEPVDAPAGSPRFLNAALVGVTSREPLELLDLMLDLERRLGRQRTGVPNEPRIIDLDLILHGSTRCSTPRLTLPHPRAGTRAFVLEPVAEIAPWALRMLTASVRSADAPHPA